ncbi:type IV pilus biogenesis protein PilP, partial [Burkholderia pseudomallei]|nr:type IV pilus biogenesis protein PilP [Burkholderia pseudomallei]
MRNSRVRLMCALGVALFAGAARAAGPPPAHHRGAPPPPRTQQQNENLLEQGQLK